MALNDGRGSAEKKEKHPRQIIRGSGHKIIEA